ncbi:NADPH-dependent F420 reductase [Actinoallomurus rhizosphaericola]|uniref:NADPH-dependent F420 reductase n=1 Tax=Actinoallomurus rhizosphaericola TaxID=2952536 RepID=UPI002090931B|nr:NADPH-dependent F420 reductase [Actinoallomurus rhizosphaericola]MCO5992289.1 NADPH-dependent F420 reductase [Actinoallomurus rhizosphaericola]
MKIGVIGAGRIGGNAARLFAAAGHDVFLSFSRAPVRLREKAAALGPRARSGDVRDAVEFGDVLMLSVPWTSIPGVLEHAGPLQDKIVIDTTNHFGPGGIQTLPGGLTAAQFNARRMPGARLVKAFNTLTAGFQASEAGRPARQRVVLFHCGDDPDAKTVVAGLITDAGFAPADLGGLADAAPMEAPRRAGAVYGEEYRPAEAVQVVEALREGRPLPPPPDYPRDVDAR